MAGPLMDQVASLMREVAAGEITPRYGQLAAHEVRSKTTPEDLVTVADEAAERALARVLPGLLPGSMVVGEEAVHADPSLISRLDGDDPVWVIDPVDGTRNFASGRPVFRCMVALVRNRRSVAAWILDPISGTLWQAEQGGGTWCDGERRRCAPPDPIDKMTGFLSWSIRGRFAKAGQHITDLGPLRHEACCGAEYGVLVDGTAHYACYRQIKAWDHAPGVLLHHEAGGVNRLLDGRSYRAGMNGTGLLCAPDTESWEALRAVLAPVFSAR